MKSRADKVPPTQLEVLERVSNEEPRKAIADDLGISVSALNGRLARLYARLGVHTSTGALRAYVNDSHPKLKLW